MTRLGVRDLLTPSAVVLAGLLVSSSIDGPAFERQHPSQLPR